MRLAQPGAAWTQGRPRSAPRRYSRSAAARAWPIARAEAGVTANNADTLLLYSLDSYFDLDDTQQALARLQHPHIAHLIDAGRTLIQNRGWGYKAKNLGEATRDQLLANPAALLAAATRVAASCCMAR